MPSVKVASNINVIESVLNYELAVAQEGFNNRQMKKFLDKSYEVVSAGFGQYVDARARANPKSLHHIYEWKGVGTNRLWALTKTGQTNKGFRISYRFMQSRKKAPISPILLEPNPKTGKVVTKTYVFRNKAMVMESGQSVTMRSRGSGGNRVRMAYPTNRTLSGIGFTYGPLTVKNPGGPQTTFGFQKVLAMYFGTGQATKELKMSGAMEGPTRRVKRAAEQIPASIRSMKIGGSMSYAAVQAAASAAVERQQ